VETTLKKIGKYEITGILGRGGMGVVYRAEDKRIGRKVAIKTLTEGFTGQPEMLERFYREAQAGILQHPNIVIVFDLGDEDGMPFIVMEFVDGEPLGSAHHAAGGRQRCHWWAPHYGSRHDRWCGQWQERAQGEHRWECAAPSFLTVAARVGAAVSGHGSISWPMAALMSAWVRVGTPSFLRALSR